MDFQLSADQHALADGIRALCQGRLPLETLREHEGADQVLGAQEWAQLADAGVFSIMVPEAAGGVGLGLADATVVFEELGAALVPGPIVGTVLAAAFRPDAADGRAAVGILAPPPVPGTIPLLVHHLAMLDAVVILPPAGAVGAPAVTIEAGAVHARRVPRCIDPLTPLWEVVGALPDGTPVDLDPVGARLSAAVLTAALQVGIARSSVERAVEYAQGRRQFGRPIGSFQAIKHLCADMLVRTEVARAAVHAAAVLMDQPDAASSEADTLGITPPQVLQRAAAGAKLLADDAALRNTRTMIQVHGGMGFTWEVPAHLYLKRSRVLASEAGASAQMAETVAALL